MEKLTCSRGTTFAIDLEFKDLETGAAIDIRARKLLFTAVKKITDDDTDALIRKSYTIPSDADALAGLYALTLSPTDTLIPVGEYFANCRMIEDPLVDPPILVDDTSTFILEVVQAPTTRYA